MKVHICDIFIKVCTICRNEWCREGSWEVWRDETYIRTCCWFWCFHGIRWQQQKRRTASPWFFLKGFLTGSVGKCGFLLTFSSRRTFFLTLWFDFSSLVRVQENNYTPPHTVSSSVLGLYNIIIEEEEYNLYSTFQKAAKCFTVKTNNKGKWNPKHKI